MKNRSKLFVLLIFMAAALLVFPPAESKQPHRRKVLIIGIDGCRPDALKIADTKNLDALIEDGAFSAQAQAGDITMSGPGWASMLTGVWRHKHGVTNNRFRGSRFDRYPHFFRRLKEERPEAWVASIVHWRPIHDFIVTNADLSEAYGTDAEVARAARRLLVEGDPDVVFLQFDDVDHAGHVQGFDAKGRSYIQAIETVDRLIGTVLKALRRRKNHDEEDWLILVSTDHGGLGNSHGADKPEIRTIFLIVSGAPDLRGELEPAPDIVDIPATALMHLGIAIKRDWNWDGSPIQSVPSF